MPLSEHEQHLLEQMEQALYAEDPKFASQMQGASARARLRHRMLTGTGVVVAGLVLVILGVVNEQIWLGALGFVFMVAGAAYAFAPPKTARPTLGTVASNGSVRPSSAGGSGKKARKQSKRGTGSFMQRMEERWDRRRNDWR